MTSRYRIRNAPSETDREIAARLERARREVEAAVDAARKAKSTSPGLRRTLRDLNRVLSSLEDVRPIAPKHGRDDPDTTSEEQRIQAHRERVVRERAEARAAKEVAE